MNNFLRYYDKHNISPVSQKIDDFASHKNRRSALYRQLGLPFQLLRGKNIAEIGPGGGYNALATIVAKPESYTLIEPSVEGFRQLKENFSTTQHLSNINLYNTSLEYYVKDHASCKLFDVVICEGLIPGLDNKADFLKMLDSMVLPDGFLVVTCADAISVFFEHIRRAISINIIKQHKDKKALVVAFRSHFDTLLFASRSLEDWVLDALLNPAAFTHLDYFSIKDAFEFFGSEYYYYGSSPLLLSNHTWYKEYIKDDTAFYNAPYIKSYELSRHNLISHLDIFDLKREEDSQLLYEQCNLVGKIVSDMFLNGSDSTEILISACLKIINIVDSETIAYKAIEECISIFSKSDYEPTSIANIYPNFVMAFGRGQQYISFQKKGMQGNE